MRGVVFDIQRWSLHDGPGIRTNVFLKGCPLSCAWCSNPESQETNRELAFFKDKCIGCLRCVETCPYKAIKQTAEGHQIDYEICKEKCFKNENNAFACTKECYAKALKIMGSDMPLEEVMQEVMGDEAIYRQSGGGLTVTGGEPFAQPEFLRELLKAAKEKKLHTAVETSLFTKWEIIRGCLPYLDFMFMDFKLVDEKEHEKYTGVSNKLILENMKKISEYKKDHSLEVVVRTPVIPSINDDEVTIRHMGEWIAENAPEIDHYQLLPYHRLGRGKYANIGKEYSLTEIEIPDSDLMKRLEKILEECGLKIVNY